MWLGSGAAFAQRLSWLAPSGTLSPDGAAIGLVRTDAAGRPASLQKPSFGASGASLRPGPPAEGLLSFVLAPNPGATEVKVWAEEGGQRAELTLAVGPPAARVGLTLTPAAPVKGQDEGAELEIRLLRADGTPDPDSAPPVLVANVGRLEPAARQSPGVYKARYHLPSTRYPEVAVLVALSAWPHPQSVHGAFGSLRVPLATAIELPGRTEPGAKMTLEIAGKPYGPTQAEGDGRFRVPVVVPPGHRMAKGVAVDRHGNKRVSSIDLMLPPTDQLACVANPTRLPADGVSRARVLCALSDPYGRSVANARAALQVTRGTVSEPRVAAEGVLEWIYTAPRGEAGVDALVAAWREAGPLSREELKVELVQGPVAKLSLRPPPGPVLAGATVELAGEVVDALGRPRAGALVEAKASVGTVALEDPVGPERSRAAGVESPAPLDSARGERRLRYTAPLDADFGEAALSVRAYGPQGSDPARLSAWLEGGVLYAAVSDLAGWPVPGQPLLAGGRELLTGVDGTVALGPPQPGALELRHGRWNGLRLTVHVLGDGRLFPQMSPARGAQAKAALALAPGAPVNVRAAVSGREVTFWAEDADGKALPGRALSVRASAGTLSPVKERDGRQTVTVSGGGADSVSIADAETGVTALVEVGR